MLMQPTVIPVSPGPNHGFLPKVMPWAERGLVGEVEGMEGVFGFSGWAGEAKGWRQGFSGGGNGLFWREQDFSGRGRGCFGRGQDLLAGGRGFSGSGRELSGLGREFSALRQDFSARGRDFLGRRKGFLARGKELLSRTPEGKESAQEFGKEEFVKVGRFLTILQGWRCSVQSVKPSRGWLPARVFHGRRGLLPCRTNWVTRERSPLPPLRGFGGSESLPVADADQLISERPSGPQRTMVCLTLRNGITCHEPSHGQP